MGRGGVPDRWLSYKPLGERIPGTHFIAFKVPLKEGLIRNLPQKERFTTQVLMESVPNLGLVIDLTNTDRYYNKQDILGQGIRYEKILCRGHEIPNRSVVDKFFSAVDKYLEFLQSPNAKDSDGKLIGVHCTHGLNRTGYLVCRYMIRRLGFTPEDAISAFEKARGYPMERETYLRSLRRNEESPERAVSIVNDKSHSTQTASRSNEDSTVSDAVQTNGLPDRYQETWPAHSSSEVSQDFRTESSSDFFHSRVFWRSPANRGSDGFRSYPRGTRNSSSRPSRDYRPGFRNNFADSSRDFRGSAHPYRREFETEERGSYNSGAVYRRYHEPDYDRNRYMGPRRHRRSSSFSHFRGSRRHESNWRDSN